MRVSLLFAGLVFAIVSTGHAEPVLDRAFGPKVFIGPARAASNPRAASVAAGGPTTGSGLLARPPAGGLPPTDLRDVGAASESAELCTSIDGHYTIVRGFGLKTSELVEYSENPKASPLRSKGITIRKDPRVRADRTEVTFDMFELMAEPFGETLRPRAQWKATYAGRYQGKITVFADSPKSLGSITADCNEAIIEYR